MSPALDAVIATRRAASGGGLSSSAALEVATATLLEAAAGHDARPTREGAALPAGRARFAGVPCGIMDQLARVLGEAGHALLIDCRTRSGALVPLADPGVAPLICNTHTYATRCPTAATRAARALRGSERAARWRPRLRDATLGCRGAPGISTGRPPPRAATCRPKTRARWQPPPTLSQRDFAAVGALMFESHRSLRDDFEVSSPELDVLVDIARELGDAGGVLGARMTGGGFGGCTVDAGPARQRRPCRGRRSIGIPSPHRPDPQLVRVRARRAARTSRPAGD